MALTTPGTPPRPGTPADRGRPAPTYDPQTYRAQIRTRVRTMKADGLSYQAIVNQLHAEGVPTLSGKDRWHKGTISNLLAEAEITP
jgi:hypothetical protein